MKIKEYRQMMDHLHKDDRGDATGAFRNFVREQRALDQEPRTNYSNGLSVDPERDSDFKIGQALGAYRRYRKRSHES